MNNKRSCLFQADHRAPSKQISSLVFSVPLPPRNYPETTLQLIFGTHENHLTAARPLGSSCFVAEMKLFDLVPMAMAALAVTTPGMSKAPDDNVAVGYENDAYYT